MNGNAMAAWGLRLLTALSFGLLAAGNPPPTPSPADLVIDFTSDFKGSLEPCG